jgi:hypothetical protein
MSDEIRRPWHLGAMARRLRVPASWLRAEAEAGRLPHLRAGNALLFDPNVVERMLLDRLRGVSESSKEVSNGQ